MRIWILILLTALATGAFGQSNTYRVNFNSSGLIEDVNTPQLKSNRKLTFSVSFNEDDSLVRAHYKSYYERRLSVIEQLTKPEVKNELDWFFNINSSDVDLLVDESKSYINSVPESIKESFGYPNVSFNGVRVGNSIFSPYSIDITGYSRRGQKRLVRTSSQNPELRSGQITYEVALVKPKDIEKVNYQIRFNKPIQSEFNRSLNLVTSVPTQLEYKRAADSLASALKLIEQFDKWLVERAGVVKKPVRDRYVANIRERLTNQDQFIDNYYRTNSDFVKSWLWYTGGIPKLNPFETTRDEGKIFNYDSLISVYKVDSIKLSNQLADAEKKYVLYTESIVKVNLKDKLTVADANGSILTTIDQISTSIDVIRVLRNAKTKSIDSLRSKRNSLSKEQRKKESELREFNVKDVFLYNGYTFTGKRSVLTSPKKHVYYRNFNRADNLKPLQNLPLSYDQTSTLYILIENETAKNTMTVKIKELENEQSPFAVALNGPLDQLGTVGKFPISKSHEILAILPKQDIDDTTEINMAAIVELKKRMAYYKKTLVAPPSFPTAFQSDASAARFTDYHRAIFPDTTRWSYRYSPTIGRNKEKLNDQFRVNKVYRILPSVGLVFSDAKDPEVVLNNDGTIKEVNYFDKTSVMLGLKVYPLGGSPIYDSRFIISRNRRPNIDYRKIHIVAGVNATQPLKQFYLGAGVDLWSGLSINSGFHAINKKQQKIVSGKIDETNYLDYKNVYVSINVDVSVALKIISLISSRK